MYERKYCVIHDEYDKAEKRLNDLSIKTEGKMEILRAWDAVGYDSITIIVTYIEENLK